MKNPIKILIVDDSSIARKVLEATLNHLGYDDITMAKDGSEAIALAKKNWYAYIFMDLIMPGMHGYHASELICQFYRSIRKPIPKIAAVTAKTSREDGLLCLESGMTDFIRKPFDIKDIEHFFTSSRNQEKSNSRRTTMSV